MSRIQLLLESLPLDEFTLRLPGGAGLMIMKRVMRVVVQTDSNARESTCCGNNNFANFGNFGPNHK